MHTTDELYEFLTTPSARLIEDITRISGDILILGAGGKIGPSLAIMAKRACKAAGIQKNIIAASLYDRADMPNRMREYHVQVMEADLFHPETLPECPNIIFMAGRKFGTADNQSLTWAINVLLPAKLCERFPQSRFVVFSTGNIYGDIPAVSGGSLETDAPNPDGEYGQTCLGRERIMEYYASRNGTQSLLFRLNYAIELRYGVLYDIAKAVHTGKAVSLSRGIYNCIWQGDVCEYAIRSLLHTSNPPNILNVTGPESISTKWTAMEFARMLGVQPVFCGEERSSGIFSNTVKLHGLLGYPGVSLAQMMRMQADWIMSDGSTIQAPTHFESVNGVY